MVIKLSGTSNLSAFNSDYSLNQPAECGFISTSALTSLRGISWTFIILTVFEIELLLFLILLNSELSISLLIALIWFVVIEVWVSGI